jgi:hypothetical protein
MDGIWRVGQYLPGEIVCTYVLRDQTTDFGQLCIFSKLAGASSSDALSRNIVDYGTVPSLSCHWEEKEVMVWSLMASKADLTHNRTQQAEWPSSGRVSRVKEAKASSMHRAAWQFSRLLRQHVASRYASHHSRFFLGFDDGRNLSWRGTMPS